MLIDEKYLKKLIQEAIQPLVMTPSQIEEIATGALASALALENHSRVEIEGQQTMASGRIEATVPVVEEKTTLIVDTVEEAEAIAEAITLDEFMDKLKAYLRSQDDIDEATRSAKNVLKDMFDVTKFKDVPVEDLARLLTEITK